MLIPYWLKLARLFPNSVLIENASTSIKTQRKGYSDLALRRHIQWSSAPHPLWAIQLLDVRRSDADESHANFEPRVRTAGPVSFADIEILSFEMVLQAEQYKREKGVEGRVLLTVFSVLSGRRKRRPHELADNRLSR
jgi:hypothetical protein